MRSRVFILVGIGFIFNFVFKSHCVSIQKTNVYQYIVSINDLNEFAQLYSTRPIKNNSGGMKSTGMFWVWFIVKKISPDLIVESGVWKGQSTWLLEQAAPKAKIISIDPNLSAREYISPQVEYYYDDFSQIDFGNLSTLVTCCFFDDHQNALSRVEQAYKKGFNHLIFDDNYPVGCGSHFTLEHCLASDQAEYLISLINDYIILPQIFGITTKAGGVIYTDLDTLGLNLVDGNLDVYKKDALSYRWTTYVQLKQGMNNVG